MATRRVVGLLTLLTLGLIAIGVSGAQLPGPSLTQSSGPAVHALRSLAVTTLARQGDGLPEGSQPAFLTIDPSGIVVVSDTGRKSVLRLDGTGHLLTEWGPRFNGGTLDEPAGVAASADTVYVVDRGSPRIFALDQSGGLKAIVSLEAFGTYGLNGLAVDASANLYLADTGRNRILVFTPNGTLVRTIGRPGTDLGGLTQPMMIAFGPDGGLFVADWENSRVERWNSTFEPTNYFATAWRPFGIAVDAAGHVFVPDTARHQVLAFTGQGTPLGEFSLPVSGRTGLDVAPRHVAVKGAEPSVYALGGEGLLRIDFDEGGPVVQSPLDIDLASIVVLALMVSLLIAAAGTRRARRRSVSLLGPTFHRPVGLHAEDGAQGNDQQARSDQDLLIAHQAKGQQ